jgi:hypothetical protein
MAQIGTTVRLYFLLSEFYVRHDSCSHRSVASFFLVVVLVLSYRTARGWMVQYLKCDLGSYIIVLRVGACCWPARSLRVVTDVWGPPSGEMAPTFLLVLHNF